MNKVNNLSETVPEMNPSRCVEDEGGGVWGGSFQRHYTFSLINVATIVL